MTTTMVTTVMPRTTVRAEKRAGARARGGGVRGEGGAGLGWVEDEGVGGDGAPEVASEVG